MSLPPATPLPNLLCHREPCSPAFVSLQPAMFLNELEGVAFVLKKFSCSSQRWNSDFQKPQITRQFYLFTASHWRKEQACLVPQRSMKIWQFVAVTPGLLPLFQRFWDSKKNKHQTPRMQKQAPTVFIKQTPSICSKTIRILINIRHSHTAAPESWPEH